MSSVAARLEARAADASTGSQSKQDNATVASANHAEASAFLVRFDDQRRRLENDLSALACEKEASTAGGNADDGATLGGLKEKLVGLQARLAGMQAETAASGHLLTAYDLRSTKLALAAMEEAIGKMADTIQPRKKFAFKKKTAPSTAAATAASEAAAAAAATPVAASAAVQDQLPPEDPRTGFSRRSHCVLVKAGESVRAKDVMLTGLKDCVVFVLDRPSALRCHQLERCHVYVGPCSGSVLIYGAVDCTFHLAARQLRIHDTHRTTFHLHALSNPIIEHTDTTGFAAYDFAYPELARHLDESGFVGKESRHATVEDFNWLRSQQSPNWYAVPTTTTEAQKARPPVTLTEEQTALMTDMADDQPIDDAQQTKLKQLMRELKIVESL